MNKEKYYRDTRNYYLAVDAPKAHKALVNATGANLKGLILDFGCATGTYSRILNESGITPVCVDLKLNYLQKVGPLMKVNATIELPFKNGVFDGAICFEVLEHLENPSELVRELRRCVKGTVIFSVPNCEANEDLGQLGLTYEHFLDLDHRNFFDTKTLKQVLSEYFTFVEIKKINPINPFIYRFSHGFFGGLTFMGLKAICKIARVIGLLRRSFYIRLLAICK